MSKETKPDFRPSEFRNEGKYRYSKGTKPDIPPSRSNARKKVSFEWSDSKDSLLIVNLSVKVNKGRFEFGRTRGHEKQK